MKDKSSPEVSVIIPVYNVEKYLPLCIDSVRRQTLKDIEIILVDDGSPDSCPDLCDAYSREDNRIRVIHKKNAGLGYARNSGLEIARGRWISFVDSDDYLSLNMLETCVRIGNETSADEVRFLSTPFISGTEGIPDEASVDDASVNIVTLDSPLEKAYPILEEITCNSGLFRVVPSVASNASAWGAIFRRSVFEKGHLQFPSERELISEDNVFNLEFASVCGPIAYTGYRFYHYRQNPQSLTSFRADRIERSASYCAYMTTRLAELGYSSPSVISAAIMLGYLRTHFWHIFTSEMPEAEKKRLHSEAAHHPYIRQLASNSDYKALPFMQRLAFRCRDSYLLSKWVTIGRDTLRKAIGR